MKNFAISRLPALLLVLSLGGLAACGDNPVGEEEEDHPVELRLLGAQGQTVVSLSEGTSGAAVTGQITVPVNGTVTYTVVAISESGVPLALDGDELAVQVSELPQNATVSVQGANQIRVVGGAAAGTGSVRIELVHEGHAELGAPVSVVVQ